jgi:hypothetical protein
MEKARNATSSTEGSVNSCEAWMHFAGGETSAGRPGITWMIFLVVFLCAMFKMCFYLNSTIPNRVLNPSFTPPGVLNADVADALF